MDFKGWQKIAEDKKTVTMKHPKGHSMTILLKGLPSIQREGLKRIKLAEGTPETPLETEKPPYSVPLADVPQTQAPAVPPMASPVAPNGEMDAQSSLKLANQGSDLQQQVDQEKGKQLADVQKGFLDRNNQIQEDRNKIAQQLWKNQQDVVSAMKNGDIKAGDYVEHMSVPQKTMTALGLFLGGLNGAGNNGAMDYLNKQIDRNIDAQKQNFEHKKTIWGAYQDLYNNNDVSYKMARAANLEAMLHQADLVTAQLATPQAAAANAVLKSKFIPEINKHVLDSAGLLTSVPNGQRKEPPQANAGSPRSGPASDYVKHHMDQMKSETAAGMEGAEAAIPDKKEAQDDSADSILNENAEKHLDQLRYTPKAKEEIDQIKQQYTQAQQADTILGQLHEVHQKLAKDTKSKDYSYLRRHNPLQGVPIVGEALQHNVLQPITDNPTNRDFETNRTRIVSDIANAVGPNVPGVEIERMVDANLPEVHDSPSMLAQKERNIRIFIKNRVPKSLLKDWGLAK